MGFQVSLDVIPHTISH
uniref:Uncharacterized protein n=1 Tax=Rhizophora mucronata TaxID=61149 RepID=A0A2P2QWR7_RHIMU